MADLISKQALLSELEERFENHQKRSQRNVGAGFVEVHKEWAAMAMGVAESLAIVRCTPAVDAVEVVRCKDCKRMIEKDGMYVCNHALPTKSLTQYIEMGMDILAIVRPDDFCSYGERRGEVASEVMMQPTEG